MSEKKRKSDSQDSEVRFPNANFNDDWNNLTTSPTPNASSSSTSKAPHPSNISPSPPWTKGQGTSVQQDAATSSALHSTAFTGNARPTPAAKKQSVPKPSTIVTIPGVSDVPLQSSSDATKPLLSWRAKTNTLISRLKRSTGDKLEVVEMAEFASPDMIYGKKKETDDIDDTTDLLSSIRDLPSPMAERRRIREDLLKASLVSDHEFLHLPIEAFCFRLKRKIVDAAKEAQNSFTLWSSSFKAIEGRFGTGVVSYFVFLRWLLLLNSIMFIVTFIFIVLPQVIGTKIDVRNITSAPGTDIFFMSFFDHFPEQKPTRKTAVHYSTPLALLHSGLLDDQLSIAVEDLGSLLDTYSIDGSLEASLYHAKKNYSSDTRVAQARFCSELYQMSLKNRTKTLQSRIQGFFEGSGWMENTTLFTGYFVTTVRMFRESIHYSMPVAFLVVSLLLIFVNIIMMMSYTSEGVQESMLEKLQEMYCCIVFCGWDFCLEEPKAVAHQQNSIFQEIISMLAECRRRAKRKEWTNTYRAKIYSIRVGAYVSTILILVATYYLIFYVTSLQLHTERNLIEGTFAVMMKFLPSFTISCLNFIVPLVLQLIIPFEEYKVEKQTNELLIRIVLLRVASLLILVCSFYYQIICEPKDFCAKGYDNCPSPWCWETYVGQQMYRLTIMDFFVHVGITFAWESPRMYVLKRWKNKYTNLLGAPLFDIPTNVLSLVYSQTLAWVGMFYCPLLPAITVLKMIIIFYMKKFTVLKNCHPADTPYKASRSNAIFVIVLMISYFISIGISGYSITQMEPSPGCSPFRYYDHMVHALTYAMQKRSPEINQLIIFMFSPLIAFPVIILLCLTLYYYITKTWAHKKMVHLLKVQLTMEGKDKQFLLERVTKIRPVMTEQRQPRGSHKGGRKPA